jgi:peptide/nickel transport system permease protein
VGTYVVRRLLQGLVTVFGAVTLAFFLVRLSGNPAALLLGPEATRAQVDALSAELGFDRPMIVQYGSFLAGVLRGDFGRSVRLNESALAVVGDRLPATLELALTAFVLGTLLAVVLVVAIQLTGNRILRDAVLWVSSARQAVPSFWFGLLLVLLFAVTLGWLPALGRNAGAASLILPAVTVATLELALYVRLLDAGFGEQRGQDYVRTAHAKGVKPRNVVIRHILPNAVLPLVTVAGLNLGALLGGTIVVELVFNWPGVGQLLMESVSQRDYAVVQAALMVIALVFVGVNLLVDVLYGVIDPRVRLR